ncbi:hypothetical protein AB0C84_12270 [Actinomadura sp. NPDC048955]|uniref:hypothetical protein n=1 Tax=Actinomadura sp. NPDC048955 TaxID=3158228 RepID=UPI0033C99D96
MGAESDCRNVADDADPRRIGTPSDLKREFDLLRRTAGHRRGKHRLSLQDLVTLVRQHHGSEIPRSTLDNYLSGRTLPPPTVYDAILQALDVERAKLRLWGDAWDRLDEARRTPPGNDSATNPLPPPQSTESPDPPSQSGPPQPEPPRKRRFRRGYVLSGLLVALALTAPTAVFVITTSGSSPRPAPASSPELVECTYKPVGEIIRVHPTPNFDTERGFETINDVHQTIIGSCRPTRAEPGSETCGVGPVPVNTWIQVRSPYTGWIFEPCLRLKTNHAA